MGWRAIRARGEPERGTLAQPLQRPRLTAALAPAVQHAIQQRAVLDPAQHLHQPAAVGGGAETHEVQLACVADPRGAVQRAVDVLAPPQPHVELARAHTPLVGVVEARQRVIALTR
ncbi:MAG: hypothetical protein ACLQBY_11755 [Solirubrobacteraceae bacterium]